MYISIEQAPSEYRWQTPLQEICACGIRNGYNEVDRRYGPESADPLPYHELEHTAGVTERTIRILTAMRSVNPSLVSLDDSVFAALVASHHDLIQNFTFISEGLDRVRVPDYMNTEAQSFEQLEQCMSQREGIFGARDTAFAGRALFATVCNRDFDGSITQPYIEQSMWAVQGSGISTFIIPALAMADLGDAGMSRNVIARGNAMFRERHMGITTALTARRIDTFSKTERDFIREKMIGWARDQIAFVQDRRNTFEEQCQAYFPQNIHSTVEALFPYFDYSEQKTSERYAWFTSGIHLSEMIRSMGYK